MNDNARFASTQDEDLTQLGMKYHNEGDYPKAAECFQKAMEAGNLIATRLMGWFYQDGLGVEEDIHKAIALYQKCADAGDVEAKTMLADIYRFGFSGVMKDPEKAIRLYREAADAGDLSAMVSLGSIYSYGHDVPRDEKVAFEWYRKAAEMGDHHAMEMVGILYQFGDGVEEDEDKAREWYRRAGVEEKHFPDPEKERQMELFNRWSDTREREEFIRMTMMIFPDIDKGKAEMWADKLGYF